jgi:hypothetical protein
MCADTRWVPLQCTSYYVFDVKIHMGYALVKFVRPWGSERSGPHHDKNSHIQGNTLRNCSYDCGQYILALVNFFWFVFGTACLSRNSLLTVLV